MAIARVGSTTGFRGGAGSAVGARAVAAGNTAILTVQHQNGAVSGVTDDASGGSNSWTLAGDTSTAGATSQRLVSIYYCIGAKAFNNVTVAGVTLIQCLLDEWFGIGKIGATPAVASRASSASPAAATVASVLAGDLTYGCIAYVESVAGTPLETLAAAGYATTLHYDNSGASTSAVAGAYSLTATGTTGPAWTMSPAASTGLVTVTFKPSLLVLPRRLSNVPLQRASTI